MTRQAYFDSPAIGWHDSQDIKDPALFYQRKVCGVKRASRGYETFGQTYHALTLEGQAGFDRDFVVVPPEFLTESGRVSTSKAAKEWKANQGTRTVISPSDYESCKAIAKAVHGHALAAELLSGCQFELVKYWTHPGLSLSLKAMADAVIPGDRVIDLKGCQSLDTFEEDIAAYGYTDQLSWYADAFGCRDAYLIAVEKDAPYRVGVWAISEGTLAAGRIRNLRNLSMIRTCREHDDWPSAYASARIVDTKIAAQTSTAP